MHIDARQLDNHSVIEGDICIIGAGAAGISMALEWIGSKHKVILLEGGGFDYEDALQDLYDGKTTGQRYYPLKGCRLHYFGGTTGHWAGFCSPFEEIDFKQRDWVPHSGWPISRKALDPFYERAHKNVDLGPYDYSLAYWQTIYPSYKPLPVDEKVVWNKLWQFSPPTRFGSKYKDAIVQAKNIHLYTYANVVDIKANATVNNIEELTIKNHAGKQHTVKAKYFVSACCSIQNARLLLSSNKQAPKGLGNDHDNVGRYFMEHLEIKSAELWLEKPDPMSLYMIEFGKTKARAELAISAQKQEEMKILNGTVSLEPLEMAKGMPAVIDVWTGDKKKNEEIFNSWDKQTSKAIPANGYNSFELMTRIEQAPNPDSRVTLDQETDALGMPRAKLNWAFTTLEKRSIRTIHHVLAQELGKAGIARLKLMDYLQDEKDDSWPSFTGGGWHHMGTTRMGNDPATSVVDANCKVHGINNLYIAGSSCYVTAAAPNPTLTLIALTLRLSDHLKGRV